MGWNIKRTGIIVAILTWQISVFSQNSVIDRYVDQALESNIALKQKEYSYTKSLEALKEAKRMFFPIVSLQARYSRAEGGRTVVVPFGEIMNPAYDNLEAINHSLSQSVPGYPAFPAYPQIDDYTINFVRPKEQETKIQLVMPVFNDAIIKNREIKEGMAKVEKINVDIYKRELVKEVKAAWFNYLRAGKMVELYRNSLGVTQENLRNSESLYHHDKVTMDEVYAARAKIKEMEKELSSAQKDEAMARAWFNFLLNRDLKAEIQAVEPIAISYLTLDLDSLVVQAVRNREELVQLDQYINIQQNKVKQEAGSALPEVGLWASYGYQGEKYSFTKDDDFAQIGISLSWDLFTSGQRKAKVRQARIDRDLMEQKKLEAVSRIRMEVMDAWYSLNTARKGIDQAEAEAMNYRKAYNLVSKKYQRGMASHLQLSNALNNLLNAENKLILARYDNQIRQVELERVVAGDELCLLSNSIAR
ncbi:MAG: Outer membrane efflux protein [Proteiniphilum acetatigenes]|uniref:Outer membrane efflux protein n=1 Tax=Proteiniphilum acetatigenes TaxID=294710 RepID=A0A101HG33_9BACT|nr:MAG: Outer membrane efflux protein [Proteiniphilum acetatigenes]